MLRQFGIVVFALATWVIATTAMGQIFTDDLSSGANWVVVQDFDASAEFGFDYSTKGVPAAPNGSDTIGLKFEVNNNDGTSNSIVAINNNEAYTGQFTFRVDAWLNWAPDGGSTGTGTTEFLGVSTGHDGSAPLPFGGSFIYSSDGDSAATDYRMYKVGEQLQSESGQYAAGTEAGSRDSANPYYVDAFPAIDIATAVPTQGSTGTSPAGAGGFQWMTVNVEVDTDAIGPSGITSDAGFARISMRSAASGNTIAIGTIDNSNGDFFPAPLGGSIGLLMQDIFSSVAVNPAFSFGLFDNVQVLDGLVPLTPTSPAGDFNASGSVEGQDFLLWQTDTNVGALADWVNNYGGGQNLAAATAVPEPATGLLLTLGAGALFARKRGEHLSPVPNQF